MKSRLANAMRALGRLCASRADWLTDRAGIWIERGQWFADAATWLTSREPWRVIRARRKQEEG